MVNCDYCGVSLYWIRRDGNSIPMEKLTHKQHICSKKPILREPQIKRCDRCNAEIYWKKDPEANWIPIDYETDERHKCTGAARDRDRAWDEDQEYWRRGKRY